MTDQYTTYDAAYLLGALTPHDRAAFEEHLATCKDCRHGVNELAGLPGLLASVPVEQARTAGQPGPDVPDTLLPRLLAEVERARFRRRWMSGLVGSAAAAVLAVLVAAGIHFASTDSQQPAPQAGAARQMTPVSADIPIKATAALTEESDGTFVQVRCIYTGKASAQFPGPINYTLVVVDKSGQRDELDDWDAIPGEPGIGLGQTSWSEEEIASVLVLGPTRKPVLTLEL